MSVSRYMDCRYCCTLDEINSMIVLTVGKGIGKFLSVQFHKALELLYILMCLQLEEVVLLVKGTTADKICT